MAKTIFSEICKRWAISGLPIINICGFKDFQGNSDFIKEAFVIMVGIKIGEVWTTGQVIAPDTHGNWVRYAFDTYIETQECPTLTVRVGTF